MSSADIIKVSITKDKSGPQDKNEDTKEVQSHLFTCASVFPVVVIFDRCCSLSNSKFLYDVIRELRKTSLDEKIWCSKDSAIFHMYNCHFETLSYILSSRCVLLFLLDHMSLKRLEYINYLQALKLRVENKSESFKLISIIGQDPKFYKDKERELGDELFEFVNCEILNNGFYVDLTKNPIEESLTVVANILPKMVSHLYTPHQFAFIDLFQFYQNSSETESDTHDYEKKPMHLWNSNQLCDWLSCKGYSKKVIEEIEIRGMNGWIIQNVTSEDLLAVIPSCSLVIRNKLVNDVYNFLNDNDVESRSWQMLCLKVKVQAKEVYIISDICDSKHVDKFIHSMQSYRKTKFLFTGISEETKNTSEKLKEVAPIIAKSQIIIVFITKNVFVNGLKSFKKSLGKKILFSIWLKKSVIFVLWDDDLKVKDLPFKIIIDNQLAVDFRYNLLDSNCKLLSELLDNTLQQSLQSHTCNHLEKRWIYTVANIENSIRNIDFSGPENQIKRKIILHYHTESQNKVESMKNILENNNFLVDVISVDRKGFYGTDCILERNRREEIILNADTVLSCLSPNYVKIKNTKEDLKLICQILHKKIVAVLLKPIPHMKLWHQIQTSLYSSTRANPSRQPKPFKTILTIDLTEDTTCSKLLQELKSIR